MHTHPTADVAVPAHSRFRDVSDIPGVPSAFVVGTSGAPARHGDFPEYSTARELGKLERFSPELFVRPGEGSVPGFCTMVSNTSFAARRQRTDSVGEWL